eukprot:Opistho-2@2092
MQTFMVVRCCADHCATFQVHQVNKAKKWTCKICGTKQSVRKTFVEGAAAHCRVAVQGLNKRTIGGAIDVAHTLLTTPRYDEDGCFNGSGCDGANYADCGDPAYGASSSDVNVESVDWSSAPRGESKWAAYTDNGLSKAEETDDDDDPRFTTVFSVQKKRGSRRNGDTVTRAQPAAKRRRACDSPDGDEKDDWDGRVSRAQTRTRRNGIGMRSPPASDWKKHRTEETVTSRWISRDEDVMKIDAVKPILHTAPRAHSGGPAAPIATAHRSSALEQSVRPTFASSAGEIIAQTENARAMASSPLLSSNACHLGATASMDEAMGASRGQSLATLQQSNVRVNDSGDYCDNIDALDFLVEDDDSPFVTGMRAHSHPPAPVPAPAPVPVTAPVHVSTSEGDWSVKPTPGAWHAHARQIVPMRVVSVAIASPTTASAHITSVPSMIRHGATLPVCLPVRAAPTAVTATAAIVTATATATATGMKRPAVPPRRAPSKWDAFLPPPVDSDDSD